LKDLLDAQQHRTTTDHELNGFKISLSREHGKPYAFEKYRDNTTNTHGYYAEGGLVFEGNTLVDYDGVYILPIEVANILESEGYRFAQYVHPLE